VNAIAARGVVVRLGGRPVVHDVDLDVPAGQWVGLIGPNGAGKTTLFRMIIGQDEPDSGKIRLGDTVKLGYVDQSRESLAATIAAIIWKSGLKNFCREYSASGALTQTSPLKVQS